MATLVKNHDRYALQFYEKNRTPKRKRVSLGTKDKRTAQARQRKIEYDYLSGAFDPWTMDPFSYDKQDRVHKALTILEAFDCFFERKRRDGRRADTLRTYREVVGLLMQRVGEALPLPSLSSAQVDAFVRADGLAPATQRKRYSQLRIFLRWCVSEELLRTNPLAKVTMPDAGEQVPKTLTAEELDLVCRAVEDDYRAKKALNHVRMGELLWLIPLFRFTFYTGMRASEIGRLRWEHIDFERRLIYIHHQKNRKAGTIPLNKRAAGILHELERDAPDAFVFRSPRQTATERNTDRFREHLTRMFTRYRKQAGIERQVTFHGLRHSFCTALAEAGKSAWVIQAAARHSSITTSQRYVSLANEHLKAELDEVFE